MPLKHPSNQYIDRLKLKLGRHESKCQYYIWRNKNHTNLRYLIVTEWFHEQGKDIQVALPEEDTVEMNQLINNLPITLNNVIIYIEM